MEAELLLLLSGNEALLRVVLDAVDQVRDRICFELVEDLELHYLALAALEGVILRIKPHTQGLLI